MSASSIIIISVRQICNRHAMRVLMMLKSVMVQKLFSSKEGKSKPIS